MKFTVFTPTYNRKMLLARLYQYLINENYNDLEWIIIDDGSVDQTKEYIMGLKCEAPFKIKYFYQINSGKYVAFNKAIDMAEGEYFICLDSDDIYVKGAFVKLENYMCNVTPQIAGLCYLAGCLGNSSDVIGTPFPEGLSECNLIELYGKYGVKGDKGILHRTEILKQFRFPVIDGEKFITESVLYAQISLNYNYILINEIIELVEYQSEGLSSKYKKLLVNNPMGSLINYSLIDKFDLHGMFLLKNTIRLVSFVLYLHANWMHYLKNSKHKLLFALCTPFSLMVCICYRLEKLIWK